nr:5'-3' exoribonuclease 1-like [Rhipicephalus microplus]
MKEKLLSIDASLEEMKEKLLSIDATVATRSMYVPEEITFHLLRLSLLREYLELESQELKITIPFNFKMDNSIDDWVLMCFLVANDFLSHLPNLHIAHNVRLVFYQAYIDVMPSLGGYINEYGKLNSKRFEKFLTRLSQIFFQFDYENFADVQAEQKFLGSKRAYAEAPNGIVQQNGSPPSGMEKTKDLDEKLSQSAQSFLSGLLEKFSHLDIHDFDSDEDQEGFLEMEFHQRKRDYYVNKLENSDVNKQVMQEQAHVWAIQWNLHYYYNGVQSWKWFYLHNYSPYISDIKYFQNLYMTFELGKPFLPFQQHKPFFLQPVKSWCPSPSREPRRNPACTMGAHVQITACRQQVVQHRSEADLCTAGGTAAQQRQTFY